ncbi:MAG: UDP-N-acetylmuramoyl-L-alanine--D-glutamate ligase, partial [Firmicutes bacterium]|nr:UDP-N-acetylmuramoyl-L-alanine--D-glutamate ligase [Bacillota bacterium]
MELKNKKIMAVGMAKSGISAAKLCQQSGAHVTVYDGKKEEALTDQLQQLKGGDYTFILGREPLPEELAELDYMILSPGVPTDLPFIVKARELGVKIWGEVELGYGLCKSPLIGITGTNGKTTTTTLVGEIMKAYRAASLVAGNIGTPFTEVAQLSKEEGFVTIELSSFQLETIETFRPRVSAILNFTPDHLDRHKTFENYVAAKCRVYENQTAEDVCVLNYDDELCRRQGLALMERENAPQVVFFSHTT